MGEVAKHFSWFNDDDRSAFANDIFKLIYNKYYGEFSNILMLKESSDMVDRLYEHVRNIYEVIDSEIPMMAYIQVYKNGSNGYSEWEEYSDSEALDIIESYCHKYYSCTERYK